MLHFVKLISILLVFTLYLSPLSGQIAEQSEEDKTLAPYFFVQSDDAAVDQLPLKETRAAVNISGVIADVVVTQVYKNEGNTNLEAIYIFPASTRAAVYAMKMTIGERVIRAKIESRSQARADYNQALSEGRTASLLEQQRPNVFQMNVGNILPGDQIIVELYYTELLLSENQRYEFVYPTVVGPRYSNQKEDGSPGQDTWVKNPYLQQGQEPSYLFDISITLSAGLPIEKILSPSHDVQISYSGKDKAEIMLNPAHKNSGNRDFILKYVLSGNEIRPGLLLFEGEKENFFLMMLQPPQRVNIEQIPGREYVFIVDVSGSMNGFPLDISKKLFRNLLENLRPTDCFNVLLFASGSSLLNSHSLKVTPENITKAIHFIDNERGGGGTELLPALARALKLPVRENYSRTIVIATDGYIHVEKEAFELIRNNLGKANMFAFGIGTSVNRYLIEGMARAGMGDAFIITSVNDAAAEASKFRKYITSPVLTKISYQIHEIDAYDIVPHSIPDIFAERPVLIFGKWRGKADGAITIHGISGGGKSFLSKIKINDYKSSKDNSALMYLWARHRISLLQDYNHVSPSDEVAKSIEELGLKYSLLTEFTSFIATDTEIRLAGGQAVTVRQALPLPQGVSNLALAAVAASGYGPGNPGGLRSNKQYRPGKLPPVADRENEESVQPESEERAVSLGRIYVPDESLESVLQAHVKSDLQMLEACYREKDSFGKTGKLVFKLIIDAGGSVKEVIIVDDELGETGMTACLKSIIKAWMFKQDSYAGETMLIFELVFNTRK